MLYAYLNSVTQLQSMENVNKYPLPDDNPPSYDVAVAGYNQTGVGPYQYPSVTPQNSTNIPQSTPQQFQYHHEAPTLPYTAQIPAQNYQVVTVLSPQPCILGTSAVAAPRKEIPRNIKIISYIGVCVCVFVVIMAIRNRI